MLQKATLGRPTIREHDANVRLAEVNLYVGIRGERRFSAHTDIGDAHEIVVTACTTVNSLLTLPSLCNM